MAEVAQAKYVITAENQTKRAFDEIKASMGSITTAGAALKTTLVGLAAGISVGAIVQMGKEFITSAAALDDFSEKTGSAVEKLSELQQVAKIGGQDFGAVSDVLVKLSRALAGQGTEDESKGVGAALKRLGLSADELRSKDPSDALRTIAIELNKYEDSGGKAALVTSLLGKNAAQLLPYLKDLATETGISAKVTAEQAAQAEQLEKALKRLSLESYNTKQAFLLNIVPSLNAAIEQFNAGKKAAGGFFEAIYLFGTINPFKSVDSNLQSMTEKLAALEAKKQKGSLFDFGATDRDIELTKKRIEFLQLQKKQADSAQFSDVQGGVVKGKLDFKIPDAPKAGAGPDKTFENAVRQLENELAKAEQLSRRMAILRQTETGDLAKLTASEKERLVTLAEQVDRASELEKVRKADVDGMRYLQSEAEKLNKEIQTLTDKWKDLADPTRAYNRNIEEGLRLLQQQKITIEEFNKGADPRLNSLLNPEKNDFERLNQALKEGDISLEQYNTAVERLRGTLEKTKDAGSELFDRLKSGFEEAITSGKDLGDVVRGLGQDLLKIFVRSQITEPLGNAAKDIFKGGSGAGGGGLGGVFEPILNGVGGWFKSLFGAANGVDFTVPGSGGTDSQLLAMRVTPGERVTVRTPQQQAGGGSGVVINQTLSFGSDVNRSTLLAWGEQVKRETVAAVADARLRGGGFATAMGR